MNVLLKIEYNGTAFSGWQVQKDKRTVQGVIEDTIFKLTNKRVKLIGSGRTDAGVHAVCQVANFLIEGLIIPPKNLKMALNNILPKDIAILEVREVPSEFNARISAKRKTYLYKFLRSDTKSALYADAAMVVPKNIDLEKMAAAVQYLVGTHDFKGFSATNSSAKTTIRTVYSAEIKEYGDFLEFHICGNGFLYNMVRIIVGTLVDVGMGKKDPSIIREVLNSREREMASKTAVPQGLYLLSVEYDDDKI